MASQGSPLGYFLPNQAPARLTVASAGMTGYVN